MYMEDETSVKYTGLLCENFLQCGGGTRETLNNFEPSTRSARAALHRGMDDGQHWTHSIPAKGRRDHTRFELAKWLRMRHLDLSASNHTSRTR